MKTKLLFTFFSITFFLNSHSQQEASNYLSGLEEPSAIISQGTMLYVQGYNNLYQVDTTVQTPVPNSIYSPPANFYMTNLTIRGSIIYISEENYDEDADEFFGCRIISIDLNNLAAPATLVFTTTQYISALTINGTFIYFTSETDPDIDDNFIVQIYRINTLVANPPATLLVSNLSENEAVNDLEFYSNNLLISVGGLGKIFGFDTTDEVPNVTEYLSGLSFNKGFTINANRIFLTQAHFVSTKQLDIAAAVTNVAQNTAYQDTFNGTPFFANFRDTALIGDKLYMTLLNQGRVLMVQDPSFLATNEFNLDTISIYNSETEVFVSGLEYNQNANLYNLSGQLLTTNKLSIDKNSIDVSSYPKGVYILKLENQKVFKFIK